MSESVGRPYPAPVGRTARRLEWQHLPPELRAVVEGHLGTPVAQAVSQTAGFTPGFASVLVGEDGSRHFVKAASVRAQRVFADSYREEARKLAALPDGVPAPRLRWGHGLDGDRDWVVLGIEHVEGRAPSRPWTRDDLDASLAMLATTARVLTPPPADLALDTFAAELAGWPAHWDYARAAFVLPHGEEAAALAARYTEVVGGSTVVHTDVRDDNILLRPDGTALLCDWNWPVVGAAWLDSLLLLIGPRGDGLDVEAVLADHPTFAGVDPEAVDVVLALVAGYFLKTGDDPVPSSSPYIREHQRWQADVVWDWLCERRGWATGDEAGQEP
ncbi:phosphotransferase family protein [Nocardioides rubriscoriae]|uniref:phosphotransferase family protein n=1 Tax=Nocardioides rubriscoriae TaxID=642762 RepID=UPI0011E04951|nr:phosphotransferase [Nocardioides rubriscoriae]